MLLVIAAVHGCRDVSFAQNAALAGPLWHDPIAIVPCLNGITGAATFTQVGSTSSGIALVFCTFITMA